MSWLASLSSNHMPPVEISEDTSKLFNDFVAESVRESMNPVDMSDEQFSVSQPVLNQFSPSVSKDEIPIDKNELYLLKTAFVNLEVTRK